MWEDDATATTTATTVAKLDVEDISDDEKEFEEENRYRDPPAVPLYKERGRSKSNKQEEAKNEKQANKKQKNNRSHQRPSF